MAVVSTSAEEREFTDASGRKIVAELVSAEGDTVTIRRGDGNVFTIAVKTLSESDQAYLVEWKEAREAERVEMETRTKAEETAHGRREHIVAFCEENSGIQVGNGECWTLANEAFEAAGARRPGRDSRVWGRMLDLGDEDVEAGDIVEFRSAKIGGYGTTGPEHTAVVIDGGSAHVFTLAHQNWGGDKTVAEVKVDLRKLVSGEVMIYRPE